MNITRDTTTVEGDNQSQRPKVRGEDLPTPSPNFAFYNAERQRALDFDPRKAENYARYTAAKRTPDIDYLPVKMDIENVSRCNFACTMCQVSAWPGRKRAEDMPLKKFRNLIDSQYGLVEIKIQGMGEPTMQGDDHFEMIRYARARHIWVRTTTNASLLHLHDNYKKLIDADPNDVQISVDGADKLVYEDIRRGGKFEQVKKNCRLINDYCREKDINVTQMWVVLQSANISQMRQFVGLAHELGFRRLSIALNLNDWGQDSWKDTNTAVTVENQVSVEQSWAAVEEGRALGIDVGFWNNTSKYSSRSADKLCPWPFERAYVSSDLRVVPCCMIGTPDVLDLGDANSFTDLWHGQTFQDFRQAHLDGDIPRACQGCYEAKNE